MWKVPEYLEFPPGEYGGNTGSTTEVTRRYLKEHPEGLKKKSHMVSDNYSKKFQVMKKQGRGESYQTEVGV